MAPASPGRLKRRAEFLRVAAKGRKAPVHGLVLQALVRDDDAPARLGFTVTKKVGNAVIRNRIKRSAREWLRRHGWVPVGNDVVFIAKETAATHDGAELGADLGRLTARMSPPRAP